LQRTSFSLLRSNKSPLHCVLFDVLRFQPPFNYLNILLWAAGGPEPAQFDVRYHCFIPIQVREFMVCTSPTREIAVGWLKFNTNKTTRV